MGRLRPVGLLLSALQAGYQSTAVAEQQAQMRAVSQ